MFSMVQALAGSQLVLSGETFLMAGCREPLHLTYCVGCDVTAKCLDEVSMSPYSWCFDEKVHLFLGELGLLEHFGSSECLGLRSSQGWKRCRESLKKVTEESIKAWGPMEQVMTFCLRQLARCP